MKKRLLCALLGVCLCFGAALPLTVSAAERSLFQNGTLNRGITGWSTWTNDPSGASFSFSKDGGVDGTGCLKIENTKQVAASFYQMTGLKKGKTYYFKVKSYKKFGSKKLYSSYSTVKKVKISK